MQIRVTMSCVEMNTRRVWLRRDADGSVAARAATRGNLRVCMFYKLKIKCISAGAGTCVCVVCDAELG